MHRSYSSIMSLLHFSQTLTQNQWQKQRLLHALKCCALPNQRDPPNKARLNVLTKGSRIRQILCNRQCRSQQGRNGLPQLAETSSVGVKSQTARCEFAGRLCEDAGRARCAATFVVAMQKRCAVGRVQQVWRLPWVFRHGSMTKMATQEKDEGLSRRTSYA